MDADRCSAFHTDGGVTFPWGEARHRPAAVGATNIRDSDVTSPPEPPSTPDQDHTDQVEAAAR